jgi:hypothetical protein
MLGRYRSVDPVDPTRWLWMPGFDHSDKQDAMICALVGHLFAYDSEALAPPPESISATEGWIWVPGDVLPEREDA